MSEKPILFNSEMVCAILDGRKTQTRRIAKSMKGSFIFHDDNQRQWDGKKWKQCPYGTVGDRLYVREKMFEPGRYDRREVGETGEIENAWFPEGKRIYVGDTMLPLNDGYKWRTIPSIHMHKWACRIWLEVTAVRVERVQDISCSDAFDEGVDGDPSVCDEGNYCDYIAHFSQLWDSINTKRGYDWESNPFVWVIEFRRIKL